ncbi:MAG: hypothetical protein ACK4MV_08155 [Beijerinckiaceae bacterium]
MRAFHAALGLMSVALLLSGDGAKAQAMLKLAGPEAFRETYLAQIAPQSANRAALVGVALVGIHTGPESQPFDPSRLEVLLPPKPAGRSLCVRIISRDGRYSAQGRYILAGPANARARLEFTTQFEKVLRGYAGADIAVHAFSADTCSNPEKTEHIIFSSSQSNEFLVLKLRGGDARVRAQLGRAGKPVSSPVLCDQADGVRVGFTSYCQLPVGRLDPGAYQISIGETRSDGSVRVKTYSLAIAPAP